MSEPLADIEVTLKPWHIIVGAAGIGLAIYLLSRKGQPAPQETPPAPAPTEPPKEQTTQGLGEGYFKVGIQDEPVYDGHPLADKVKQLKRKGIQIFKTPTGEINFLQSRERFPMQNVWAAMPGLPVPPAAERV